jgi:hypothetical protein
MIIDLFKADKITPKGCYVFSGKLCHLFGIYHAESVTYG